MSQVLPWVAEQRRVPTLTVCVGTVKILIIVNFAVVSILWNERTGLEQTVDIAPVHTILSQGVIFGVGNRDVFTDGDDIEVLSLQEHVVAVEADSVTLVVRSLVATHDTFVAGIGVRHGKLRHIVTTSQGNRVVVL